MPTRIIPKRQPEPACCGGSFLQNEIIMGKGTADPPDPCVDTDFQILLDSPRMWLDPPVDWQQTIFAGGSSVNTGALVIPNNDGSISLNDSYITAAPAWASFDESKDFVFSYVRINNAPEFFVPLSIAYLTIQTATRYVDIAINSESTGTVIVPLGLGSLWTLGNSPQWAVLGNPPQADRILFTLVSFGAFDGFTIGTMALTYTDCI